jgi:type II secretory ATPase GspE/PulE/Tfp pilus assembly ATPase PilB-like protein
MVLTLSASLAPYPHGVTKYGGFLEVPYGYSGRMGVFEVVKVDAEIRRLISSGAHQDDLQEHFRQLRIGTVLRDGLQKVAQGQTTMDELFRVLGSTVPL